MIESEVEGYTPIRRYDTIENEVYYRTLKPLDIIDTGAYECTVLKHEKETRTFIVAYFPRTDKIARLDYARFETCYLLKRKE